MVSKMGGAGLRNYGRLGVDETRFVVEIQWQEWWRWAEVKDPEQEGVLE